MNLPVGLIIMDGFGIAEPSSSNAISVAKTPNLDKIFTDNVTTQLQASGEAVGLPDGQMGNSEVGHLNIGAGRIVYQELTRINNACKSGDIENNKVLLEACEYAKKHKGVLHFMGLISDGGVHSNNEHLYALLDMAVKNKVPHVFVHCFMDGRDVPPKSGIDYIRQLEEEITIRNAKCVAEDLPTSIQIASVQGRYYVMDRDNRWERVERGYDCIVNAKPFEEITAADVMQNSYDEDKTDEFVEPVAINSRGMKDGDSVVFFNFRPDRAREITRTLTVDGFDGFDVSDKPKLYYACMTEYDATFTCPVCFPKEFPENVLADVLADAGLKQYHTAETEKYAHVTFFLNGGREAMKKNEERKLIDSPKVATYDLQPEMSEPEVTDSLVQAIENDEADVYIVNFANCDMVGHTGVLDAAIKAVEAVDEGVGKVVDALSQKGGAVLITADHGNADKMVAEDGSPHTAHTTNPVPFVCVDFTGKNRQLKDEGGALCDIAPTFLDLIGIDAPTEMTGKSLLND
ncbi:MAG: 2,3-bisphosphoglycerate-independent phosphoglycerate mutase [Coriobacteriia bacterium]|nr:2,3-bisphosphoglycerate-independent phosphoglycerate mutase [Coriobacteriia bacterium]